MFTPAFCDLQCLFHLLQSPISLIKEVDGYHLQKIAPRAGIVHLVQLLHLGKTAMPTIIGGASNSWRRNERG